MENKLETGFIHGLHRDVHSVLKGFVGNPSP